mmetsp:Transcript_46652/g.137843  ORF Transcript_46652/g.137843 Transcript_46652/m.137843 type:complete len:238 (-) Transcript_46652:36-749(-)
MPGGPGGDPPASGVRAHLRAGRRDLCPTLPQRRVFERVRRRAAEDEAAHHPGQWSLGGLRHAQSARRLPRHGARERRSGRREDPRHGFLRRLRRRAAGGSGRAQGRRCGRGLDERAGAGAPREARPHARAAREAAGRPVLDPRGCALCARRPVRDFEQGVRRGQDGRRLLPPPAAGAPGRGSSRRCLPGTQRRAAVVGRSEGPVAGRPEPVPGLRHQHLLRPRASPEASLREVPVAP